VLELLMAALTKSIFGLMRAKTNEEVGK